MPPDPLVATHAYACYHPAIILFSIPNSKPCMKLFPKLASSPGPSPLKKGLLSAHVEAVNSLWGMWGVGGGGGGGVDKATPRKHSL